MTSYLAKFVLGRIFQESSTNKEGREDPYYEYPASELQKAGKRKSKRRKKALPPGLTDSEGEILTKVKRRAYRLDMSFGSFLGVKFGWGSVIGIVPGIGDVLDALLSLMVVKTAMGVGLPFGVVLHMLFNVALDFVIGLVPFVGDLIDAGYKCSTRNAVLLEKHLRKVGQERLREQGITNAPDDSLPTGGSGGEDSGEDIDLEAQASASRHGGNGDRRDRDRDRDRERERERDHDHRDRRDRDRTEGSRSDGRGPRRSDRRDDRRDDHRDDRRDVHRDDHRDDRRDVHRDDRRDDRRDDYRDDRDRREATHSKSRRKDNGRRDDRDSRR